MKQFFTITKPATFDAAHAGAHFTFDGIHYMNAGEYVEVLCKMANNLPAIKDASTPYNVESDIPEYHASVKSSKATLVNKVLAETFEKSLDVYFANTVSSSFWYGSVDNNLLTIYKMTAPIFRKFLEKFGYLDSKKVRLKAESKMMIKWLQANT